MIKYETKMRVEYYETDAMGIVHHSNYIRYFETARTELFRSMGYSYDEIEEILFDMEFADESEMEYEANC